MARQNLDWRGRAVSEKVKAAAIVGVNSTMAAAVRHAKSNHPWQNRSLRLERNIKISINAAPKGRGVSGTWGVTNVKYALALEKGATIVPVTAKALAIPQPGGGVVFVQKVTIPAYPYLLPAADATYPLLAGKIRAAFNRSGGGGE